MQLHEGPVYVYYTSRGKRLRRRFENGADLKVGRFYRRMERKGRKPAIIRVDAEPTLFPTEGDR